MLSRKAFNIVRIACITLLIGSPICVITTYVLRDSVYWPCMIAFILASFLFSGGAADMRLLFIPYDRYVREREDAKKRHESGRDIQVEDSGTKHTHD